MLKYVASGSQNSQIKGFRTMLHFEIVVGQRLKATRIEVTICCIASSYL